MGAGGPLGAGKTFFVNRLTEALERLRVPYQKMSAGDAVRTELEREGVEQTRDTLHERSKQPKERMSSEEFIDWLIENTPQLDWHSGLILIDGIREPGNHTKLQKLYPGRNVLVYFHTSEKLHFERVVGRDNTTREDTTRHFSDIVEEDHSLYFLKNADYIVTEERGLDEVINSLISSLKS